MWRFGLARKLKAIVGKDALIDGGAIREHYPSLEKSPPKLVCQPQNAQQISQVLHLASSTEVPIALLWRNEPSTIGTAKGAILIDLVRMNKILEIDSANLCAIVQPLASLPTLAAELEAAGLAICSSNSDAKNAIELAPSPATGMQFVLPPGIVANIGGKPQDALGYSLAAAVAKIPGTASAIPTAIFLRLKRQNQLRRASRRVNESSPSPAEAEVLRRLGKSLPSEEMG
jgi:glycolate oxidase